MSDSDERIPEDLLVVLRAQIDQMAMLAPEMARSTRDWFDAFTSVGFTDSQALYLTAVQLKDNPGKAP